MTPSCTVDITPDSLTGIVLALEGVRDATVLLNGPTGCKYYHSSTSDMRFPRKFEYDELRYPDRWYFRQSRVPSTYLDTTDYVYGSEGKLQDALEFFAKREDTPLLAIVNTPGAALIGDDLDGIVARHAGALRCITFETPGFSSDACHGHELAATRLLEHLVQPCDTPGPMSVNLLGLGIYQRFFEGDVQELERLLGLCGVTVNAAVCAGSSVADIERVAQAALNVVVRPEWGMQQAELLEERFGMKARVCEMPPVGFAATEKLVAGICEMLGADPAPALEDCARARARAYAHIARLEVVTGLPTGATYSVEGAASECLAYFEMLTGYLGMVPAAVRVLCETSDCRTGELDGALASWGFADALEHDIVEEPADLLFASGETIAKKQLTGQVFTGIEIALPTLGYRDVIPKTHLGSNGALQVVEAVLNGLVTR